MQRIDVLNEGYVILQDKMGSDLSVVNSARVSYNKKKEQMDEKDEKLIKYLARHDHTSPFRHATLQFEVYAPLMVARQWWKYIIGSSHQDNMTAWNESSRRYITEEPQFYIPDTDKWREKPENSKQGSGKNFDEFFGIHFGRMLKEYIKRGEELYDGAMKAGIAPEQARLFLPAYGMYVRWYWTASLLGVAHFIDQRLENDAQKEIQEYAKAVYQLTKKHFPISLGELMN